jgi:hypothetical protein
MDIGSVPLGVKQPGLETDHYLQIVPKSRKYGFIHTPLWRSA